MWGAYFYVCDVRSQAATAETAHRSASDTPFCQLHGIYIYMYAGRRASSSCCLLLVVPLCSCRCGLGIQLSIQLQREGRCRNSLLQLSRRTATSYAGDPEGSKGSKDRNTVGVLQKRGVWRGECLPTVGKLLEIRASSFASCAVGLVSLASCSGLMMLWYCCSSGCSAELWWRCTHVESVHRTL
jgi:hypothetical protein